MALARWASPSSRISLNASSVLNSLSATAGSNESNAVTYDNSTNRNLYGAVTVTLGAPATTTLSGASISLRVTLSDGTSVADLKTAGDIYTAQVLVNASAKVVIFPMVRIYPFSMRLSVINNTGVAFNASTGNDILVTPYSEEVA